MPCGGYANNIEYWSNCFINMTDDELLNTFERMHEWPHDGIFKKVRSVVDQSDFSHTICAEMARRWYLECRGYSIDLMCSENFNED